MSPSTPIGELTRLDEAHKKALARLRLHTIGDLLYHLPTRYENIAEIQSIGSLEKGQDAIVYGQVSGLKTRKAWKSRRPIAEGYVEDGSSKIKIIWFNQPYLAKMLRDGAYVKLAGKIAGSDKSIYLANPEIETLAELPVDRHDSIFKGTGDDDETLYPIYRETRGVTSKWFFHVLKRAFDMGVLDHIEDPIPEDIRTRYNLPEIRTALQWVHVPKKATHTEAARKRFAFEEVFVIQLAKQKERTETFAATSYVVRSEDEHIRAFTERFPFPLTGAQEKAVRDIVTDFTGTHPMSRLLEGDVGSGKTAVAATTAYAVATSRPRTDKDYGNLQVAYMAPTEILAKQHFISFIEYFKHLPVQIGLITGSGCMKYPSKTDPTKPTDISRSQLLKWVKNGEIPILIGTHALIQKAVEFKHLAYVIIDEQHRFGTAQRRALAKKDDRIPHLLSMTATPIPRTLALTIYGDLDVTLLDQMPVGRKPIITKTVLEPERKGMYEHLRKELESGRQAYVICPRIDEPDPDKQLALQAKSVKAEAERLAKSELKGYRLGILHSKMMPAAKEKLMAEFSSGAIDVLVATSVVEVGVNVPNATIILIEGAERFGLSQLHQLRGRVMRSSHQAHCYLLPESTGEKTMDRLKALTTAKNGFELAEYDLALRGSGELYGARQWGLTDLGMEAIRNMKMVEAARNEASILIKADPSLTSHPLLRVRFETIMGTLHFE
ncbi:MAG: ATP-dependent helicase RecG, ATP-dependent helicase RecG [Candidatus Parcubacteria bacterium]|jgi:ATP-dependent DNA helicase RecG